MKSTNLRLGVDVSQWWCAETNISPKRAPADEDEIDQSKIGRVDVSVETNISLKRAPAVVEAADSCSPPSPKQPPFQMLIL